MLLFGVAEYRRNRVSGGTYFFTVNLRDRASTLLTDEIASLRAAVRSVRDLHPFLIDAWVVLPDHMHCLWTLPDGDSDYPKRWQAIKIAFSLSVPKHEPAMPGLRRRERAVWQRRYWEHTVRDGSDYAAHMDYIHFNPVKHGYVEHPAGWEYSTFRRAVARGYYPAAWCQDGCAGDFGERAARPPHGGAAKTR